MENFEELKEKVDEARDHVDKAYSKLVRVLESADGHFNKTYIMQIEGIIVTLMKLKREFR